MSAASVSPSVLPRVFQAINSPAVCRVPCKDGTRLSNRWSRHTVKSPNTMREVRAFCIEEGISGLTLVAARWHVDIKQLSLLCTTSSSSRIESAYFCDGYRVPCYTPLRYYVDV